MLTTQRWNHLRKTYAMQQSCKALNGSYLRSSHPISNLDATNLDGVRLYNFRCRLDPRKFLRIGLDGPIVLRRLPSICRRCLCSREALLCLVVGFVRLFTCALSQWLQF